MKGRVTRVDGVTSSLLQEEKRIIMHMNDGLGGGVIAAESCTPALVNATILKLNRLGALTLTLTLTLTILKLNRLGAHDDPWDGKMLKTKLYEIRGRALYWARPYSVIYTKVETALLLRIKEESLANSQRKLQYNIFSV